MGFASKIQRHKRYILELRPAYFLFELVDFYLLFEMIEFIYAKSIYECNLIIQYKCNKYNNNKFYLFSLEN